MLLPNTHVKEIARTLDGSGAIVEPLTLADAKNYLKVPSTITADDALITDMITAARILCEAEQSRTYVSTQRLLTLDHFPPFDGWIAPVIFSILATGNAFAQGTGNWAAYAVWFPYPPLISVDAISYVDFGGNTQALDPTPQGNRVIVQTGTPGLMTPVLGKIFPITKPQIGAVGITYTAGYGTTAAAAPSNVRMAMRYIVAQMYANRSTAFVVDDVIRSLLSATGSGFYG